MTVSSAEETAFTSQLLRVFIPITLQLRRSRLTLMSRPTLAFGLTGDIFVLNATTGSAKLLKMLEGTHPRLSIRWSRSVFDAALKIAASAAPFDMRLNFVKPGVGPISWRLAAPKPVECSLKLLSRGSLSTVCTAPALLVSLTDPAANIS